MLARTTVIGIALSVVMVGAVAHGEQAAGFKKGDRSVALSSSGWADRQFNGYSTAFHLEFGWFVSDAISVGVRQGLYMNNNWGPDEWSGSTRLVSDYFLDLGRLKPFAGISIGYLYGGEAWDQFIIGPDVGARIFLNETTFINLLLEYQFTFRNVDNVDNRYNDGVFVYALGMGVKW